MEGLFVEVWEGLKGQVEGERSEEPEEGARTVGGSPDRSCNLQKEIYHPRFPGRERAKPCALSSCWYFLLTKPNHSQRVRESEQSRELGQRVSLPGHRAGWRLVESLEEQRRSSTRSFLTLL